MGFMSETKIVVGSSAFNLAGDQIGRGHFLKNTILGSVLSGSSKANGLGSDIFKTHIEGPGLKLLRFNRWADRSGFNDSVGNRYGTYFSSKSISPALFNRLVPVAAGYRRELSNSRIASVDYELLARSYLGKNRPNDLNTRWSVEPEKNSSGALTGNLRILLQNDTGATINTVVFTPSISIMAALEVLYVFYREAYGVPASVTTLPGITTDDPLALPDFSTYSGEYFPVADTVEITTTITTLITYSDSTPPVETVVSNTEEVSVIRQEAEFTKLEVVSNGRERRTTYIVNKNYLLEPTEEITESTVEVEPGLFKTTKITQTSEVPVAQYVCTGTQVIEEGMEWGVEQIYVLARGQRPDLDSQIFDTGASVLGRYFPIIPLRVNNRTVNASNYAAQYALNKKAMTRAFGNKKALDQIIENLQSNPDISSIDHAWVVVGVSLGTTQQEGTGYLFQFFKELADSSGSSSMIRGAAEYAAAVSRFWVAYDTYRDYSTNTSEWWDVVPSMPSAPGVQNFAFGTRTAGGNSAWQYDVVIAAKGGKKYFGTGMNSRANGKPGNSWKYSPGSITVENRKTEGNGDDRQEVAYYETSSIIRFGRQLTDNYWEEYEFFDLVHTNNVYSGRTVITMGGPALGGGENSPFIVPLNDYVYEQMNLIKRTQLSMECSFMVINYYDVQKVPWYASGFFKVILVVVVIVVSIYTGGIGSSGAGVLGTNAAVGAAIGFAAGSAAAIVAGAVMNAVAAMVVSTVLSKVSTALLGDQLGAIVGAVLSMVVVSYAANPQAGFNSENLISTLTRPDNLLKLTSSGVQMAAQSSAAKAAELVQATQSLLADYKTRSQEIMELAQQYLGDTGVDAQLIAEATRHLVESPEEFLGRTLMTGEDIVDISLGVVERFPEAQLQLPYMKG